jgi:hypothetical protein
LFGESINEAQTKNIIESHCNIFDSINVGLCQNLSAKYALGISNKKDAKNPIPVYIHS